MFISSCTSSVSCAESVILTKVCYAYVLILYRQ